MYLFVYHLQSSIVFRSIRQIFTNIWHDILKYLTSVHVLTLYSLPKYDIMNSYYPIKHNYMSYIHLRHLCIHLYIHSFINMARIQLYSHLNRLHSLEIQKLSWAQHEYMCVTCCIWLRESVCQTVVVFVCLIMN